MLHIYQAMLSVLLLVMLSSVVSESQTNWGTHDLVCLNPGISGRWAWNFGPGQLTADACPDVLHSCDQRFKPNAVSAWFSCFCNAAEPIWMTMEKYRGSMDGQLENPPVSSMMFHEFSQVQALFPGVKNRIWNSTPVYPRFYQNVAHFVYNVISRYF